MCIRDRANTVQITDPLASLDVGAVAKGYAVQRVCDEMPSGLLVSVGGNVCATGPRPTDGSDWIVGVQDPDGGVNDYLLTVNLGTGSIVSSGDYQRYYTVDGVRYSHIKMCIRDSLITNNPVLVQRIGMCSTMAITTTLFNGIGMGLSLSLIHIFIGFREGRRFVAVNTLRFEDRKEIFCHCVVIRVPTS